MSYTHVDDPLAVGPSHRPNRHAARSIMPNQDVHHLAGTATLPPQADLMTSIGVQALQRLAGNAAVSGLMSTPTVQRCGSTPPSECPCHQSEAGAHDDAPVQRQAAGQDPDREADGSGAGSTPKVPVLNPADPRVREILEGVDSTTAGGGQRSLDAECQVAEAESPPWMPNLGRRSPVDLGEGTRRHPKLKEPDGPSGAKCRDACGPDCPPTCKTVGTYTEQYQVGNCGYVVEFPNALLCGSHAGCRTHDACFDAAVANGETYLFGPRHNQCNQDALLRWGPAKTKSWAQGGGPYDEWHYFVDNPIVRRSWRTKAAGAAGR